MKKGKKFHVLKYVENSAPKLKKFTTLKSLNEFILQFSAIYAASSEDNWVDFVITNVHGDVIQIDDGSEDLFS